VTIIWYNSLSFTSIKKSCSDNITILSNLGKKRALGDFPTSKCFGCMRSPGKEELAVNGTSSPTKILPLPGEQMNTEVPGTGSEKLGGGRGQGVEGQKEGDRRWRMGQMGRTGVVGIFEANGGWEGWRDEGTM
jgi:hypothetical protein